MFVVIGSKYPTSPRLFPLSIRSPRGTATSHFSSKYPISAAFLFPRIFQPLYKNYSTAASRRPQTFFLPSASPTRTRTTRTMPSVTIQTSNALHAVKLRVAAAYGKFDAKQQSSSQQNTSVTLSSGASAEYLGPALRCLLSAAQNLSPVELAKVDSWLEFVEQDVAVRSGAALRELLDKVLEPHLEKQTYLVTEFITAADISLALSLRGSVEATGGFGVAVMRW